MVLATVGNPMINKHLLPPRSLVWRERQTEREAIVQGCGMTEWIGAVRSEQLVQARVPLFWVVGESQNSVRTWRRM